MKIVKSIGIVIAGFITIAVLTSVTDATLAGIGLFPTNPETYTSWMLFIALVYRTVFYAVGGFVIGKLARNKPGKHVLALAIIATLIGIIGVVAGWNLSWYAHWYAIANAVATFPAIWYGGKLAIGKKKRS